MKITRLGPVGLIAIAPAMGAIAHAQTADLPPNPKANSCYSRVLSPDRYESVTEKIVVQPAGQRIEVIPAKYSWDEKEIVVEEGYERLEVVPAKFTSRTETVVVEPAREEYKVIPAKYETRSERIKVRDSYTTWKKGSGPISRLDASTGEIMCLVEVPAEFKSVSRQVMTSPPRTERIKIPAKTREVTRKVVSNAATTRKVRVPAKVQTVRYQTLVSPPRENKIAIPAKTDTITTRKLVSQGELRWAEILCETNVTPGVVRNLQTTLKDKGFYDGAIDGRLGPSTMAAVDAYQRRNNLATGSLTLETMRKLRVATSTTA